MSNSTHAQHRTDSRVRTGVIGRHATESLAGLVGRELGDFDLVPPLWHCVHLLDAAPQSDLGPDGHARSGLPAPPAPGARRMFAGGRVTHVKSLVVGRTARRISTLVASTQKAGRSGPLTIVTVRHEIEQDEGLAVIDEHDIVYRATEPDPTPVPRTGGGGATAHGTSLAVDPVLLFRFSALTYNAHRIHYDLPHARHEGYDDLVVHGPLQVLLMGEELRRAGVDLRGRTFSYRLVAPAVGPQVLSALRGSQPCARVEVRAGNGTVVAEGKLEPGAA